VGDCPSHMGDLVWNSECDTPAGEGISCHIATLDGTGEVAGAGNGSVVHAPSFSDAVAAVAAVAQPGDMVLTLGAGSVSQLGAMILEKLEGARQQSSA